MLGDVNQTNLFPRWDPEGIQVELKTCTNGQIPADLWKTISAFSNTDGGQVLCGVRPDGTHTGLSAQDIDKVQQSVIALCQNTFNHRITPDIRTHGSVVIVQIPVAPAVMRPIYSQSRGVSGGSFVRLGSSNIQMTDEVRNQFAVAARGGAELIEYTDLSAKDCFNKTIVDGYIKAINLARNDIYESTEQNVVLQKNRAINSNQAPTLFGLLAFSREVILQEVTAPTVNIAVTQYDYSTKIDPSDAHNTHRDNREFNGNVLEQFNNAFQFIISKLPISGKIDSQGHRRDYLIIPDVAIRESLANAIAHRDYSTFSSHIQVDIYSDRVEITNPGQSLVPISEIDRTSSITRNPYLMSFLKDLHITEKRARGIQAIRDSVRSAGLVEPKIENLSSSFRISLYSSAFLSGDDHTWLQKFSSYSLNDKQLTALIHMRNTESGINNSEYRNINNMDSVGDDRRARHELDLLCKVGAVEPYGEKRYRRYYLKER